MAVESRLTTYDNPYSPFEEYDEWYAFDTRMRYYSPSLLARVATPSEELTTYEYNLAIDEAIDEIISENVSGMHRKVTREVEVE